MENTNTFTNDTMLSGIYFSPEFLKMRDRRISNWTIPPEIKKCLEESIKRGRGVVNVVNTGNYTSICSLDAQESGKNVGEGNP